MLRREYFPETKKTIKKKVRGKESYSPEKLLLGYKKVFLLIVSATEHFSFFTLAKTDIKPTDTLIGCSKML